MPAPIDRTKPPYRDDPVISVLTDEQVWALARAIVGCARSAARAQLRAEQDAAERPETTEAAS